MRVIDKLAEITDSWELERELDKIWRDSGEDHGRLGGDVGFTGFTGPLADVLLEEVHEDQKIAVRLINSRGGVSKLAYTYLVKGGEPKPQCGSLVQVPAAFRSSSSVGGVLWGIVQPDAAIPPPILLTGVTLKHIVKWVHRYESA